MSIRNHTYTVHSNMQIEEFISNYKQQQRFNRLNDLNQSLGIYGGEFGTIILLFCLSKQESNLYDIAEQKLDRVLKKLHQSASISTICNGIAGVGFGLVLLDKLNYITLEKDSLKALNNSLLFSLKKDFNKNNFDYLHGAGGIIKYFIESFHYSKSDALIAINYWLNALLENTYQYRNALKLSFKQIQKKGYNISLSHGLSSIIIILSKIYNLDITRSDKIIIHKLLKGYTDFINFYVDKNHSQGSFTPLFASEHFIKGRLAWCYGDIGIALALWKAANVLNNRDMKISALEMFKYLATDRRDKHDTFVNDACICHGSSGLGQCFKWLYSETNLQIFYDAYEYWLNCTLGYAQMDTTNIRFPFYNMASNSYKPSDSILEGDSGVLLFLLNEDTILNNILLYE